MDKKTNTEKKKIWIVLAVEVVFFLLLGLILSLMQISYLTNKQASDSENKLADIIVNKQENDEEAIRIESDFNLSYINKAKTLSYYLDAPETPIGSDKEAEILQDDYMVDGLYVLSSNKEIIATGVDNVTISFKDDTYSSLFTKDGSILTKDDNRFFSYSFTNGYIVLEKSIDGLNASLSNIKSLTYLLSSVEVGEGGYIFAVSKETKEVLYYPISSYIGSSASSIGVNDSSLNDNYAGWLSLKEENGSANYYCVSKSGEDYIFYIAAVPQVTLTKSTTEIVVIALIMCLVAVSDSLVYILIVKRDFKRHKKEYQTQVGKNMYYANGVSKKVLPISIFGVICVFLLSLYTQTLFMISKQSNASTLDLNQVEVALNDNQNNIKTLRESYNEEYLSRCYSVATLVSQNESYYLDVDSESHRSNGLVSLADGLGLEAIYVFDFNTDSSGNEIIKTIATSGAYYDFTLDITDPTAQSYPFYNVAKGYSEYYIQDATKDDSSGNYIQYIGVRRVDKDNKKILGLVQIAVDPSVLENKLAQTEITYVLNNYKIGADGYFASVDKTTKLISSFTNSNYVGNDATLYGFKTSSFSDGWSGYSTIDGVECFVNVKEISNQYVYAIVPTSSFLSGRTQISVITGVICLLMIFSLTAISLLSRKKVDYSEAEIKEEASKQPNSVTFVNKKGKEKPLKNRGVAYRYTMEYVKWDDKTPEMKLGTIISTILSILAIILTIMLVVSKDSFSKDSIIYYILSDKWEHTFNIFSATAIVMECLVIISISTIARKIIVGFTKSLGSKVETVGRLIDSIVKYGAFIVALFICLPYIGIDTTAILTGAGILTLVVGFGAQSLISDILAGIFIVFEGEFRVGDIITIGDFRGTVIEIGIRTTKVEDIGKNIKIFSNSSISGVLNMTKEYSYAVCDVAIEYDESLERVEACLEKEFPNMKKVIPGIVGGPFYKGVVQLGDSGVIIRIIAQVEEKDRIQVNIDLNREVKLCFDRNNINIPFTQIVVSERKDNEIKVSKKDVEAARKFLKEQNKESKGLEPDEFEISHGTDDSSTSNGGSTPGDDN